MYFGNPIKSIIDSYLTYEACSPIKTNKIIKINYTNI